MAASPSDSESLPKQDYKGFADQFSSLVIMSTFAAGLIIAFLSLARDIIIQSDSPSPGSITRYEFGMWLGLSAMGLHINVIVVGGRACALCFRLHAASGRKPFPPPSLTRFEKIDFEHFVRYCHRVQVLAALLLPISMHFLSYSMFSHHAFFWVLLAGEFFGIFLMIMKGIFEISLIREAVENIKEIVKKKDTIDHAKALLKGLFSSHERARLPGP